MGYESLTQGIFKVITINLEFLRSPSYFQQLISRVGSSFGFFAAYPNQSTTLTTDFNFFFISLTKINTENCKILIFNVIFQYRKSIQSLFFFFLLLGAELLLLSFVMAIKYCIFKKMCPIISPLFGKKYDKNLRSIFDLQSNLYFGLDLQPEIQFLKVIY